MEKIFELSYESTFGEPFVQMFQTLEEAEEVRLELIDDGFKNVHIGAIRK